MIITLLTQTQKMSLGWQIALLVVGLLALLLAFFMIFWYRRKLKKEKDNRNNFQMTETKVRYKIFYFWGHIAYLIVIFTLFVLSLIFLSFFIGSLI